LKAKIKCLIQNRSAFFVAKMIRTRQIEYKPMWKVDCWPQHLNSLCRQLSKFLIMTYSGGGAIRVFRGMGAWMNSTEIPRATTQGLDQRSKRKK